jgi:hypothetical protein
MKSDHSGNSPHDAAAAGASMTASDRRTLEAIFRHPLAHNLEWTDLTHLMNHIGQSDEKHNGDFAFTVAGQHHIARKPHGKDVGATEIMEIRHFLARAGFSPDGQSHPADPAAPAMPSLVPILIIVVDHHETKLYHLDEAAGESAEPTIKPYDPHHFLHHLKHKDQSRERGQRAPEEPAYYEQIAHAAAGSAQLVIVGHGTGKSNAAHHLTDYLRAHHPETAQRIVGEITADLSSITTPQLVALATKA